MKAKGLGEGMKKVLGALCGFVVAASGMVPAAHASEEGKLDGRLAASSGILNEIMSTPDNSIPEGIAARAHCVIVIPAVKKLAFAFGGQYGRGVATCRTGHGWSAPVPITLGGGSFGFQIGGQSTDVVLLGMNEKSAQDLLHSKVKLGADASAAAGPVGRNASANTDLYLNSEFLTYSRAKGLFAGLDLTGEYIGEDGDGMKAQYGDGVTSKAVLDGSVPVPQNAQNFENTVAKFFVTSKVSKDDH